jgi:uncharacterized protein (TIGR02391 family)
MGDTMQLATATDLLPVEAAAAEFRIHRTTIYRAIKEGHLGRHKSIGDPRSYVDRWELQRLVDPPAMSKCLAMVYGHFAATGEWPQASELQRELVRNRDTFDVIAALDALPNDVGWRVRDSEGRARLTVRGIARCPGSGADVDNFLSFLRMCFDRYVGNDPEPQITSDEVQAELGLDHAGYRRLHQFVEMEGALYLGGGGNEDHYKWVISDRIRHFRDVKTIHQYLAIKDELYGGRPTPVVPMPTPLPRPLAHRQTRVVPRGSAKPTRETLGVKLSALHPAIQTASGRLYATGNYSHAILEAAKALEATARSIPALSALSGRQLVEQTFSILPVADPTTKTGRGVQEGLRSLAVGAFMAFRNPVAHDSVQVSPAEAIEILGIFSLLTRRLSVAIDPPSAPKLTGDRR